MANLLYLPEYKQTSLNVAGGITNSQTTGIILTNVDNVDTTKPGLICITFANPLDTATAEFITFTSIDKNKELQGVTRGAEGVSAKTHDNGATIAFVISKSHINLINDKLTGEDTTPLSDTNGNEMLTVSEVASAVNNVQLANAATGKGPSLSAVGGDTNIPISLIAKGTGAVILGQATSTDVRLAADQPIGDSSGNEFIKFVKTASAVNEITVTNQATGASPEVGATGGDTNINLILKGKGTGGIEAHVGSEGIADHDTTGLKITLTAASNVAIGDVCYIKSDGKATLVDADAIATSSGLVMATGSISANASGEFLLMGVVRDDTWNWTVGGLIYITVTGTTGNTLSQTAPSATDDVIQIVGVATHADRMFFYPQLVQIEHV